MNKHSIPKHLNDPELFGFWTLDEFLVMVIPFAGGILMQQFLIGIGLSCLGWWLLRKLKAGRSVNWILHWIYWNLPAGFTGLKATPPSHLRKLVG